MRCVIYARFSSDRQNEESINAQVRACTEYAEKHGMEISHVYADEAISGKESKTSSRVQYQQMMKDAGRGLFEVILIHKFDRVARSLTEHVNLQARLAKWKVELVAVAQDFGGGAEAKIVKALLWSMSEYYLDNLASEVRKGQREAALQGKHNGGVPPFGYDVVDQRLVINPLEAEYVRKMFDACIAGDGYADIIEQMRAAGVVGKRGNYFQPEQVEAIRDALEAEPLKWKTITHLFLITGARRGEILGLKWSAVDFKNNRIHIENSILYSVDRGIYEDTPKTETSIRWVTLPVETMQLLRQWQREQAEQRLKLGEYYKNRDFVFCQDNGSPLHPDTVTDWMKKFSKRHSLPHINPHAFRHTMASMLYFNGSDSVSISKRLGHAQVSTTANIYAHVIEEADQKNADILADVFLKRA